MDRIDAGSRKSRFRPQWIGWPVLLAALVVASLLVRSALGPRSPAPPGAALEPANRGNDDSGAGSSTPRPGRLQTIGDNVRVSAAGLRYGPGSREGHRLQHVLLHTADQPDRPGSHGVFHGGPETALDVIDEAYQIAQQRGPPTQVERHGRRTVYTVDVGRAVGYVGGRTGKRLGHPSASHVRLVLEGTNVITAFPLIP